MEPRTLSGSRKMMNERQKFAQKRQLSLSSYRIEFVDCTTYKMLKNAKKKAEIKHNSSSQTTITFHCVNLSPTRKKLIKELLLEVCFLLEAACLLIQTNLLSNHSITPLFSSDNGLSPGLLKGVTADLRGDMGEALSVEKTWTNPSENRMISKRPEPFCSSTSRESRRLN